MKTIVRILILLTAALLVVGALVLVENRGLLGNLSRGEGGFERRGQFEAGGQPSEGGFEGRGGHEGRGGISAFTWASLAKTFGIIALIAVIYALLDRFVFRRRPKTVPSSS